MMEKTTSPYEGKAGLDLASQPAWFCLRSQTKREHIAAMSLRTLRLDDSVEVFCPRIRFQRPTRRGAVWFVEALFPGYLFARFTPLTQQRAVVSAHGVRGLVHFGSHVARIDDEQIEALREAASNEDNTVEVPLVIIPGDEVHIVDGAFRGLSAVVTSYRPAAERVKILVDFLGRTMEAEAQVGSILPLRQPRETALGISQPVHS